MERYYPRSDIGGSCLILDADLLPLSAGEFLDVALAAGVSLFQYRKIRTVRE